MVEKIGTKGRKLWISAAACLAVAAFAIVFVAASGADLAGSTFESTDGNLVVDANGHEDWANIAGLRTLNDQPSGSADNSFTSGSSEDDSNVTIAAGSIPPSKNDLTRSYLATETVSGQTFLYLAWERNDNNGSANVDFELNQQATANWDGSTTGKVAINRTEGDLLITYDFGGSGAPVLGLVTWLTANHGHTNADCYASSGKIPCWGNHVSLTPSSNPAADGAVNASALVDNVTSPSASLAAGQFGEIALNLTAIPGIFNPNTCTDYGSMFVKSRASASFPAELKDFIAPGPIHLSNCGSIELKKHWVGSPSSATLNIGKSAGTSDVATTTVSADGTTGAKTVENGNYYVSESVANASDYTSSLACTDNGNAVTPGGNNSLGVSAGHNVVCTYTNTHKGTIELKKHWVGTPSSATLNIGTSAGGSQTASATVSTDGSTGSKTVDAGTYYVGESVTDASSYNSSLACTNNGSPVTPGAGNSLAVASGDNVVCTYTNTRKGTIELKKHWVGTAGSATLTIGSSNGGTDVASTTVTSDGTTGAKTVDNGTYYLAEAVTSPGNYTSTLDCTDNGAPVTPGANTSLAVSGGHTVVCTYTNIRKQGSIELKKHWVGTASSATLTIGTSAGGSQTASTTVSADGSTGAKTVDTGTYYVGESVTNSGNYNSSLDCTDNGSPVAPGANSSLSVTDGHTVVCTYTNTRKQGTIELKKHWIGSPGQATLTIGSSNGGSDIASKAVTADDSTGTKTVDTGTYYVGENVTNPGDYTSTLSCTDNGSPANPGANSSLSVAEGHAVICTYTNTRKQGTIELKKSWIGTPSSATLTIGSSNGGSDVASTTLTADGTTGAKTVNTGTYYVGESVTDAADYTSALTCTDNGNSVTPGANNSLNVTDGHAVVCTYTNTRKGTIELKKQWVGTVGSATLNIGSSAGGNDVASATVNGNGTTGAKTVSSGTYYVGESVVNASDYKSALACTDNGNPVTPGADNGLAVAGAHTVVCTYTNTRKQGTIELKKHWVGTRSSATLTIGSSNGGSDVASTTLTNDGTTGAKTVDTGTYYVAETVVNSGAYASTLDCTDNGAPVTPGANSSLSVGDGHTVVCTYTNTRKQGTIELKKHWVGTRSSATLTIGSSNGGSDVASTTLTNDGTTGAKTVDTGTYYVAETVVNSGAYASTLDCTDNGAPVTPGANSSLSVGDGHTVVCTYTNTRKQGTIELKKHWVGGAGSATLRIGSSAGGSDIASTPLTADGSTGAKAVDTGTYFVGETVANPGNYTSTLACTDNGNPVEPGANSGLDVADGHTVVCTYTNSTLPQVKLVKQLQPSGDAGRFDLAIDQQSFTNNGSGFGDGGTTGFVVVGTGSHTVSESGHGTVDLSHYIASITCDNGDKGSGASLALSALAYGDKVTCTFSNVRKPTITIEKNTLGADGTFSYTGLGEGFTITTSGHTGSKTFEVAPGAYTVSENVSILTGWRLTGLSCNTGGAVDQAQPNTVHITAAAGDNIRCTFTNTKDATLIVKKVVDNSNGGGTLTASDFSIHVLAGSIDVDKSPQRGSGSGTSYSLAPATYRITEDAVSGYSLTSISGDGCLSTGFVQLNPGATVTCTLTNTSAAPPPPVTPTPTPPAPKIDLQITKTGAPNPASLSSNITWTMVVLNNGPSNATGVTVADPVPAGTTFVSATSTQGTCTGGAVVNCQIGNLSVGQSATITLVTKATTTGNVQNNATTVGNEAETNTANNSASASVQVQGPFVPPPHYCTAVGVAPKSLLAGRPAALRMKVTQHGKAIAGIRIRIAGASLRVITKPSNEQGLVQQTVHPKKAGIVTFAPVAHQKCKSVRVGVIGVFTPPVTG